MRHLLRTLLVTLIAALALPAFAAATPTGTSGVVVQRDDRGGATVLARSGHALRRMRIVSHHHRLALGTIVRIHGSRVSIPGSTTTATVQGMPAASPSFELSGTVLAQSATLLQLGIDGFPSGLVIHLGSATIPALAPGTPVEARVSLGPDPANPDAVVLTLVAIHVEDHAVPARGTVEVRAEGTVTAIVEPGPAGGASGSITIAGEHGIVTFSIPAGTGPTGVSIGDRVEARGSDDGSPGATPTLSRLEDKRDNSGHGHSGDDGNNDD
jgi:hypothetical protein